MRHVIRTDNAYAVIILACTQDTVHFRPYDTHISLNSRPTKRTIYRVYCTLLIWLC